LSVVPFPAQGRALSSWIGYFMEYTNDIQSSEAFREWAGIAAIAAALERKVFVLSQGRPVYPNLYTFLVGPPGSGKTRAVSESEALLRALADHHLAPVSLTKAALIDALREAVRAIPGQMNGTFNSLFVACKELGALLPGYDSDFMNALVYLYDSIPYSEKRRTRDTHFSIDNPIVNLIACTTPSYLNEMLPPGAWEQGFLSRVIIVYSEVLDIAPLDLADARPRNQKLEDALTKDIQMIGERVGRMKFSAEAANTLEVWNSSRRSHEPKHPRLVNYNTRRPLHLLKLCQIAAADRGALVIDIEDVQRSQEWLTKAEVNMADIFLAMTSGGDSRAINELHHYLVVNQVRSGNPTPKHLAYKFLHSKVPAQSVERVILLMASSGMLEFRGQGVWAKAQ
jgi:hypothetical protein